MADTAGERGRAVALLKGGVVGGHAAALAAVVVLGLIRGAHGAAYGAIAAVIALVFYVIGQAVQVMMAGRDVHRVLVASVISYVIRVVSLGGLLALFLSGSIRLEGLDAPAVVTGTLAVVVGWLVGEIVVFSRLRFPVFDPAP